MIARVTHAPQADAPKPASRTPHGAASKPAQPAVDATGQPPMPDGRTAGDGPSGRPRQEPASGPTDALLELLKLERSIREVNTVAEVAHLVANDGRKLVRAGQAFVFQRRRGRWRVLAVSSLSAPDRNAPLIAAMTACVEKLARDRTKTRSKTDSGDPASDDAKECALDEMLQATQAGAGDDATRRADPADSPALYPYANGLWLPLKSRGGRTFAGLLLARGVPWTEHEIVVGKRIVATMAHAWLALEPRAAAGAPRFNRRWIGAGIALLVAAVGAVPVPMSALAPFEIVPKDPFIVAAPMDGVIETVPIAPGAEVAPGTVLVTYADTVLRNRAEVTGRELTVAEARLKRAQQLAFGDMEGRRQLAIARAERDVRSAEHAYAQEMLAQTVVRSSLRGIAVFNDRKDLIGRPVKTGERLMNLAQDGEVVARIEMPVADVALLNIGADVKLFLDADPIRPRRATLKRADFEAGEHSGGTVSFRATAELASGGETEAPRLGGRGTAQVFGGDVPLAFYLLRRPITAVRQWLGL